MQWILNGKNLDAEITALKIGKSAEALFQEDIGRFNAFMQEAAKAKRSGEAVGNTLTIGALEALSDEQWNQAASEFFGQPV